MLPANNHLGNGHAHSATSRSHSPRKGVGAVVEDALGVVGQLQRRDLASRIFGKVVLSPTLYVGPPDRHMTDKWRIVKWLFIIETCIKMVSA